MAAGPACRCRPPQMSVPENPNRSPATASPTRVAHWSPVARVVASQIPRSISSSEKNHGLRFEGILKIDLQGNRPPKAKNRQIRLLERAQSSSLFNSFLNSSRATTPSCVVSFEIVQFLHFPMIAPTKSMGWRYRHLKRLRTYIE